MFIMEIIFSGCCSTAPSPRELYSEKNHQKHGQTIIRAAGYFVPSRLLAVVVPLSCKGPRKSIVPVSCSTFGTTENALPNSSDDGGFCLGLPTSETGVDDASVIKEEHGSGEDTRGLDNLCYLAHHPSELDTDDDASDSEGERCFEGSGCDSGFAAGFWEMNLQFLEETDERVLSERMLRLSRSNKLRSALELFFSMEVTGLNPSAHACNSLISCILRNASFDDVFRVFDVMRKKGIGSGHTYSLILKEAASARGAGFALTMFDDMEREEGTSFRSFDVIVYNTMISVCAKERKWSDAERMWRKLEENGFIGTSVTYSLLVSTFVQCGQTELALAAYSEMIGSGCEPGEDVMKGIIATCTKEGKWVLALQVLERMLENGITPNIIVLNAMINCLGKAGKLDHALRIYGLLKSSGHSPDTYTWNALLNALYRCKRYADCIRLFERISMQKRSELNVHLHHTALMSCQKLGLWDRSLQFLWRMEEAGTQMSAATYNIVMTCCEKARKPKVALEIYQHMIYKNIPPDTFTYLTLIRSCIWGSLWTDVECILEHVEPNVSLYNALIHGLCLRDKITLAQKLYGKMQSYGLKPDGKTRALMLQHIPKHSSRYNPRYMNVQERFVKHDRSAM